MKKTVRIIPRLDIKGPNLVKGIHLEGLRVMGNPGDFAKFYYENGADEIMFMDVVASLYERNSLHDIISKTAASVFIPITVGGGLRTLADIKAVLRAGADKVSINTAAIKNPEVINNASNEFGSSTIVVAIEAIKQNDGRYLAFTDNGREHTGVEATEWAHKVEKLGAGELVITSVDREGTGKGFDLDLLKQIAGAVNIPVIAHGGAGTIDNVLEALAIDGIDAVAIASILHYGCMAQFSDQPQSSEGNINFLKSGKAYGKISPISLNTLKEVVRNNNYNCR